MLHPRRVKWLKQNTNPSRVVELLQLPILGIRADVSHSCSAYARSLVPKLVRARGAAHSTEIVLELTSVLFILRSRQSDRRYQTVPSCSCGTLSFHWNPFIRNRHHCDAQAKDDTSTQTSHT